MKINKITIIILSVMVSSSAFSQENEDKIKVETNITTEGEYNFNNKRTNLTNLLNVSIETQQWQGFSLQANLLSAENLRLQENKFYSVIDDRQVFSNILLDEQLPLALFQLGIKKQITDNFSIFFGVNNLNGDYFTSSYTYLFTGSSHGIYPTIADNWSVENYPASSLGLHFDWKIVKGLTFKNSFCNGQASTSWNKVFRFNPKHDGIINVCELSYKQDEKTNTLIGEYHVGFLYAKAVKDEENDDKTNSYSVFVLIEQPFYKGSFNIGMLLQGGYSPKKDNDTYGYYGIGIVGGNIIKEDDEIGIIINRALYKGDEKETDVEITYNLPLLKYLSIQPAIHFINTNDKNNTVGLLRFNFEF